MNIKEFMEKDCRIVEEAWCKGNVDALSETHSPDILVHIYPLPDIKGLAAYKQSFQALRQGFSDMRVEWEGSVCEGCVIAHRVTFHMKQTGVNPMFNLPPAGKKMAFKGSIFLHVNNEKIVEEFDYLDFLGYLQQSGVITPMK